MLGCCIVAKNEEKTIKDAIQSVQGYVNEVVVVDNNSSDLTASIASNLGCRVYENRDEKECNVRNFAISQMHSSWILVLDADERMDADTFPLIIKALSENRNRDVYAYRLPSIGYCGNGQWSYGTLTRLFANNSAIRYSNIGIHTSVQEALKTKGYKCGFIPALMHHYDFLLQNRSAQKREIYIQRIENAILSAKEKTQEFKLRNYLGLELIYQRDFFAAETELRQVIKHNNSVMAYLFLMFNYLEQNDLEKLDAILECFFKSYGETNVASSDVYQRAMIAKCEMYVRKSEWGKARQLGEAILARWPGYSHNYINLACLSEDCEPSYIRKLFYNAYRFNHYLLNPEIQVSRDENSIYRIQKAFLSCTKDYMRKMLPILQETNQGDNAFGKKLYNMVEYFC